MDKTELRKKLFKIVLNEALKEDFQQELNHLPAESILKDRYSPSLKLRREIERLDKKSARRAVWRKACRAAARAAVVVAVIAAVSVGSLLSVSASRRAIFNAVEEWKSDHLNLHYEESSRPNPPYPSKSGTVYKPHYLPAGFTEKQTRKLGPTLLIFYQNSKGVSIELKQCPLAKEGTMLFDTEHSTQKEVNIRGEKAVLLEGKTSSDESFLIWKNRTTSFVLESTFPAKELVKIADSIQEEKN